MTSFLYFTAFTAQLADFGGVTDEEYQYWYDAQVAAGVSFSLLYSTYTYSGAQKLVHSHYVAMYYVVTHF